jgi:hypothetical protein
VIKRSHHNAAGASLEHTANGGSESVGKSSDPAISVYESRNVRPEHPKGEPGGKHIQAVQPRQSRLPRYAIEDSKNENDADPISGKRAHLTIPVFFLPRPHESIIDAFSN